MRMTSLFVCLFVFLNAFLTCAHATKGALYFAHKRAKSPLSLTVLRPRGRGAAFVGGPYLVIKTNTIASPHTLIRLDRSPSRGFPREPTLGSRNFP